MADRSAARRYARAFIELAQEANTVDASGEEVQAFLQACHQNDGELMRVLNNPAFSQGERISVLKSVLKALKLSDLSSNLLHVMMEKKRIAALPDMIEFYSDAADELSGRVRVKVSTAEPLTPQLEAEVRLALEKVTGKQVVLQPEVDEELIGGLVAKVGSKVYDASIRTRLSDIKSRLLNAKTPAEA